MAKSIPSRNRETLMLAIVSKVRRLFRNEFLKANGINLSICIFIGLPESPDSKTDPLTATVEPSGNWNRIRGPLVVALYLNRRGNCSATHPQRYKQKRRVNYGLGK
jgi:hypothetical protein